MANNPEPIQQRIEIDADTRGASEAARALDGVKGATREAAQQTEQAGRAEKNREQRLRALKQRMDRLALAQIDHNLRLKEGVQTSADDTAAALRREEQMRRLAQVLGRERAAQELANEAVRESTASHRASTSTIQESEGAVNSLSSSLGVNLTAVGLVTAAVAAARRANQEWIESIETASQRLKENAEIAMRNAEARLDLAALRGVEDPAQIAKIDRLAFLSGREPGSVARGYAVAQSVLPDSSFTQGERDDLMLQAAIMAQTRETPMRDIVKQLVPFMLQGKTARESSNLLLAGVDEAGEEDPGRFGRVAAELLPVLTSVGGLDVGEATGFVAGSTGLGIDSDKAKTGIKNLVLGIRNPKTDEQKEILSRAGVTPDDELIDAMLKISNAAQSGEITKQDIIAMAGEEGVAVALALSNPEILRTFNARVAAVDLAEDRTDSIAVEKAEGIFAPGSIQESNLFIKQQQAKIDSMRSGDDRATYIAKVRSALDAKLTAVELEYRDNPVTGITAADREAILKEFDFQVGISTNDAGEIENDAPVAVEKALDLAIQADASNTNFFRVPGWIPGYGGQNFGARGLDVSEADVKAREGFRRSEIIDPVLDAVENGAVIDPADVNRKTSPSTPKGEGESPFDYEIESYQIGPWKIGAMPGLSPSLGQTADLGNDMTAAIYQLTEELRRNTEARERQDQPHRVVNFNGPYNTGDPMVDDLDGRDR